MVIRSILGGGYLTYIKKKVVGILLPYLEFSIILLFFFFLKYFFLHSGNFDFLDGICSIFIPISGKPTTSVYALWFLPCLFLAEAFIGTILKLRKHFSSWLLLLFIIACVGLSLYSYYGLGIASIVSVFPIAAFFIVLGIWLKEHLLSHNIRICFLSCIILILFTYINVNLLGNNVDMSSMSWGNIPIYVLCGFVGSIMIICISNYLTHIPLLQGLGRNSLYFYGLHYCSLPFVANLFDMEGIVCALITLIITYPLVLVVRKTRQITHL